MSLPSYLHPQKVPSASANVSLIGLFVSKAIPAGEEAFRIDRPLVAVLDSTHLKDTCSNCHLWLAESGAYLDDGDAGERGKQKVKACLGCKVLKYCSKDCQTQSWKSSHKYECKIFADLYPSVLPNTVRMVLQLLLRRKAKNLLDSDWESFLNLSSHFDDFKNSREKNEDGMTTWQTIELMGQAALTYSSSREDISFVQSMIARVLTNTHTLTTPTHDPLGLCLTLQSAQINHSCAPNTHITFSGPTLTLRSLSPISVGSELTISYIDTTNPTRTRQSELESRYFFTCTCTACTNHITNGFPDPLSNCRFDGFSTRALETQAEAACLSPDRAVPLFKSALAPLAYYPPHRQPHPSILHNAFLNAIALQRWPLALSYALKAYFYIDPVHYPLNWHPVRVVRKWVLLRLVVQIAGSMEDGHESVEALGRFGIEWRIVVEGLLREVGDAVGRSHGKGSTLAGEVREFGKGIGGGWLGSDLEEISWEWVKLRKIADEIGA